MMKQLISMVVVLLCGVGTTLAQVYYQNTMYPYAQFGYNPAAAGLSGPNLKAGANLSLMGRLQWVGFDGAPQTSVVAFHTPLREGYGAAGVQVIADYIGPMGNVYAMGSYAYDLKVGNNMSLRFGLTGGIRQVSINPSRNTAGGWVYRDDDIEPDPLAVPPSNDLVETLGAGLYLSGPDNRFFVSLAGQNLTDPSIEFDTPTSIPLNSTVGRTFTIAGGYTFDLDEGEVDKMTLQPSIMMITDFAGFPQTNFSLYWEYTPLVVGVNFRVVPTGNGVSESLGGILGVNISGNTFFGYSYDYPLGGLNANRDVNTHELIISYTFGDIFNRSRFQQDKDIIEKVGP